MASCGIIFNSNKVLKSTVLHMDYNGYWAPLEYLYTSSSSRVLVSRHPESCIEEYQGFMYCPQCLTRFQGDEVKEYKNCCVNCLKCPMCTTVPISMFVLENGTHAYRCGYCLWTSETAQLTGVDKSDLEEKLALRERSPAQDAFAFLLSAYITADGLYLANRDSRIATQKREFSDYFYLSAAAASKPSSFKSPSWQLRDLEEALDHKMQTISYQPETESPLYAHLNSVPNTSMAAVDLVAAVNDASDLLSVSQRSLTSAPIDNILAKNALPKRVQLLSKRTLRCRRDVEAGKLSIILQPKTLPLEGDSSQKMQRGKWWLKDASAVHEVPRIILRRFKVSASSSESSHGSAVIRVTISNPKPSPILIRLYPIDAAGHFVAQEADDVTLPDTVSVYTRRPPLQSAKEILSLAGTSPELVLGAFEDELLIDDDQSTTEGSNENMELGVSDQYLIKIHHNIASVDLPVSSQLSLIEKPDVSALAELSFLMVVTDCASSSTANASSSSMAYYTKIILSADIVVD